MTYQINNMKLILSVQSSCKKSRYSSSLPKNWPCWNLPYWWEIRFLDVLYSNAHRAICISKFG